MRIKHEDKQNDFGKSFKIQTDFNCQNFLDSLVGIVISTSHRKLVGW